jgi:hypothetical protein
MPKFLEDKLRSEYGDNPRAIYGTMNKIGAMHGNKETEKGREMEAKHAAHSHRSVYVGRYKEKHGHGS